MVGENLIAVADRITTVLLFTSKYLGLIATFLGVIVYFYGNNTRMQRYGRSMIFGGIATVIVYLGIGVIFQTLAFVMTSTGSIPEGSSAILSPTMRSWNLGNVGPLHEAVGAVSQIARLLGQGFIAFGVALRAVGRPARSVDERGQTLLISGIGLIIASLSVPVFSAIIYILEPIL